MGTAMKRLEPIWCPWKFALFLLAFGLFSLAFLVLGLIVANTLFPVGVQR